MDSEGVGNPRVWYTVEDPLCLARPFLTGFTYTAAAAAAATTTITTIMSATTTTPPARSILPFSPIFFRYSSREFGRVCGWVEIAVVR